MCNKIPSYLEDGKNMETKRITIRVDEALHREVKAAAALEGKAVSEVVKALLKTWLEERKQAQS